jgi:hypothetical protein
VYDKQEIKENFFEIISIYWVVVYYLHECVPV